VRDSKTDEKWGPACYRMPSVFEDKFRTEIVRFCHLIYGKGYVASTDGNISARLPDGHIMCTPTICNKGFVKPEDMVIIDIKGQRIRGERKSSSEIAMHLLIYEMRPDIHAVVHAHPPCATAYAAAGIPLNKALISEVVLALGCIPLAEYGTPGTPELTKQLKPFVQSYDALLMANHGVVTYGANLEDAFNRMDTVEHFAKISIYTKILGRERLLSSEDVEKLWVQRQKYYGLEGSEAKTKDPMCPVTEAVSETISLTRRELIDLIEKVVSHLK
jgi:L-fuculose-phosphate aldolase